MPWGYRHLLFGPSVGAQLTNNGHKESLEQGYGGMFIWALLPEVTPHNERVPPVVDRAGEFDLVTIQVLPAGKTFLPNWTEAEWLRRRGSTLLRDLNLGLDYREIPQISLEGRFGLNRIGPERVFIRPISEAAKREFWPPPNKDLWFDGDIPESSKTLIVCGADFRRDGTRDPENFPNTLCEHEFAHVGLNAGVIATYRKKHHADWRRIQDRVTDLLNTFKTDTNPEK